MRVFFAKKDSLLQKAFLTKAIPFDGCHSCRSQPPALIPTMTAHISARGIHREFEGWYNVVVDAVKKQVHDSESGEDEETNHEEFQQDITHFTVTQIQVNISVLVMILLCSPNSF